MRPVFVECENNIGKKRMFATSALGLYARAGSPVELAVRKYLHILDQWLFASCMQTTGHFLVAVFAKISSPSAPNVPV